VTSGRAVAGPRVGDQLLGADRAQVNVGLLVVGPPARVEALGRNRPQPPAFVAADDKRLSVVEQRCHAPTTVAEGSRSSHIAAARLRASRPAHDMVRRPARARPPSPSRHLLSASTANRCGRLEHAQKLPRAGAPVRRRDRSRRMSRKVTRRPAGVSATLAAATPPTQARRPPRAGRRRRSGGDRPARAQGVAADCTSDLAQLIRDGNSQAVRALGEMGGNIGAVLASVVNFFNPAAIVSGGELAQVHEALLAGVRERVHAAPRRWRRSSSRSRARRLRRVPP
jgi:hypothetical protein